MKAVDATDFDENAHTIVDASKRIPILFRAQTFTNLPLGVRTLLFFYPNGEWDNWRRHEDLAEKAYPQSKYRWINIETIPAEILKVRNQASDQMRGLVERLIEDLEVDREEEPLEE